ncbi:MAG: hypothetical protein HC898_10475 [Phycisphaerales bacterium]|nr:hypothetical protein [Phycisphaerales bacterium]
MGMIHCDIKPHNIMISQSGIAKLADLGLVRQVSGGDPRSTSSAGKPLALPFTSALNKCVANPTSTPAATSTASVPRSITWSPVAYLSKVTTLVSSCGNT